MKRNRIFNQTLYELESAKESDPLTENEFRQMFYRQEPDGVKGDRIKIVVDWLNKAFKLEIY